MLDQIAEIQQSIEKSIAGIYAEREAISRLSEARSVQRRQEKIDAHLSNIGTQTTLLGELLNAPEPQEQESPPPQQPDPLDTLVDNDKEEDTDESTNSK